MTYDPNVDAVLWACACGIATGGGVSFPVALDIMAGRVSAIAESVGVTPEDVQIFLAGFST